MTMILFLSCSIILLTLLPDKTQAVDASGIMDVVIVAAINNIKQKNEQTMPVPDLEDTFKAGFLKGGVKATGGVFSDLSTIKRNGPATLNLAGTTATVQVSMSLTLMKVAFSHARAWMGPLSSSDAISATVGNNKIALQITVHLGAPCTTTLDSLHITDFKDIKVNFKGAASILGPLTNAFVNLFHNKIAAAVEAKLSTELRTELNKNALCSLVNSG